MRTINSGNPNIKIMALNDNEYRVEGGARSFSIAFSDNGLTENDLAAIIFDRQNKAAAAPAVEDAYAQVPEGVDPAAHADAVDAAANGTTIGEDGNYITVGDDELPADAVDLAAGEFNATAETTAAWHGDPPADAAAAEAAVQAGQEGIAGSIAEGNSAHDAAGAAAQAVEQDNGA